MFLVVDKFYNISVHSGTNNNLNLITLLKKHNKNSLFKLIHRLDKCTTGSILVSKSNFFLKKINFLFKKKYIYKEYYAIVIGKTKKKFFIVTDQVVLKKYNIKIKNNNLKIKTYVKRVFSNGKISLLKIFIKSGKLHQIRIHLSYIGHPIIGDKRYGNFIFNNMLKKVIKQSFFLHAYSISFYYNDKKYKYIFKITCIATLYKLLNLIIIL